MQDQTSPSSLENAIALQNYGVGQPVRRKEDDTLVRGKGKYTDDFNLPGQAYAWIVRSSHAHGIIKGIDTSAARAMPGVLGVWTGADLAPAGYGPYTCGLPLKPWCSISSRCPPSQVPKKRRSPARRSSTITSPTTSRWIIITETPPRSR